MSESLIILAEECSEVSQVVAKLQRFGASKGNVRRLEEEIGDVIAMMLILEYQSLIDSDNVMARVPIKLEKLKKYSSIEGLDEIIQNI